MNGLPLHIQLMVALGMAKVQAKPKTPKIQPSGFTPLENLSVSPRKKSLGISNHIPLLGLFGLITCIILVLVAIPGKPQTNPNEQIQSDRPVFGGGLTEDQLMQKYPSPSSLQNAINKGEIFWNEIPDDMKKFVHNKQ